MFGQIFERIWPAASFQPKDYSTAAKEVIQDFGFFFFFLLEWDLILFFFLNVSPLSFINE